MKQIIAAFFLLFFMACNNEKAAESVMVPTANVPTNMYGFTPTYSASFVLGPASNSETVLALWKDWKDGDLSVSRKHFADSLSLFAADGTRMVGTTDEILKGMQEYRNSFKGMEVNVNAIFAVKSTDKDEDWVAVWGTEVLTDMQGKVDSVSLQETWRFNKDGKINMMFQSARKGFLPPPPAE